MLSSEHDLSRYAEWLEWIQNREAQDAFRFLIGAAACLRSLTCHAQLKGPQGPVHDFRFIDAGFKQPFSCLANRSIGLLFYFRAPAVRSGRYHFEQLRSQFGSAQENPSAEWTVRINTVDDAVRLWAFLDLT